MSERDGLKRQIQDPMNEKFFGFYAGGLLSIEFLIDTLKTNPNFGSIPDPEHRPGIQDEFFFVQEIQNLIRIAQQDAKESLRQGENLHPEEKAKYVALLFTLLLINKLDLADSFILSEEENPKDSIDMDFRILNGYLSCTNSIKNRNRPEYHKIIDFLDKCNYNVFQIVIGLLIQKKSKKQK